MVIRPHAASAPAGALHASAFLAMASLTSQPCCVSADSWHRSDSCYTAFLLPAIFATDSQAECPAEMQYNPAAAAGVAHLHMSPSLRSLELGRCHVDLPTQNALCLHFDEPATALVFQYFQLNGG